MMAAMGNHAYMGENNLTGKAVPSSAKKPIPNGCKKYFFTRTGSFCTDQKEYNDITYVFDCIASSDKVAKKKFNKWKSKNL